MKALVEVRDERPPHRLIADVDAFNVDRVLTRSGRGAFAFNTTHDLHRDILHEGRIVVIKSTTNLIPYVGIVTQLAEDAAAGAVEVSGDNYTSVAYNAALDRTAPIKNMDGGTIAKRLLTIAQGSGRSLFLEQGVLSGTPLLSTGAALNFGTQTLGQALDALAERVGDEWWIEHVVTRRKLRHLLYWRRRRGADMSQQIVLDEGRDFTRAEYKRDALGRVRSVIAVGGGADIAGRSSVAVAGRTGSASKATQAFVARLPDTPPGPLVARDIVQYRPRDDDATVLADAAQRAYERPSTARETLALTITSRAWSLLRPGDSIGVRFHSLNYGGLVRVVRVNAMQPDENTGECDLDVTV